MGGKSHEVSDAALNRLRNISAPAISLTYVNLLRVEPTSNDGPTGWVEWGVVDEDPPADDVIPRVQIYANLDAVPDPRGEGVSYWSATGTDGSDENKREIHNINGVKWSAVDLAEDTTVLALGVFKSASSTYEYNAVTEKAQVIEADRSDLLYWNTLDTAKVIVSGETVVFLTTKIKVTEQ